MSRLLSASSVMSGVESSMTSEKNPSSLGFVQFGFQAKTSYDADEALLNTRSENFKTSPVRKTQDIWTLPPPDFRFKVYEPSPPKRNTRESMLQYDIPPRPKEHIKRNKDEGRLPKLFEHREREPEIITRFHTVRPFTAKKQFVSHGMYHPGSYENPKLHDFRQYPSIKKLGLDEFVTDYEKDPFNIHFKSQRLNYIHGLPNEPPQRNLAQGKQLTAPLSPQHKWESQLILEKTRWPQKSEAFSRFRRRHRQPYSAFMERVEEDLTTRWYREQMETALLQS